MSARDKLQTLLKHLGHSTARGGFDRPLFNEIELQLLHRHALMAQDNPFLIHTDVQHPLLGERTSSFSGNGYEFAEHRRYVAGDDMRFIDWRVLARTGKLYRKVFHEERRPQLVLVVDRRAAMRFGTRNQLKVSSAVGQAIRLAYQARQQNILTGGVILEDSANWIQASQSAMGIGNIIQHLNRPCPPLPMAQPRFSMASILNELAVRLTPGCIIYLLSDFHDLDTSSSSSLFHLAQQHRLYARHILDPAELQLPASGQLTLYDDQSGQAITIDTGDTALARRFAHDMQQKRLTVGELLQGAGAEYQLHMSGDVAHG